MAASRYVVNRSAHLPWRGDTDWTEERVETWFLNYDLMGSFAIPGRHSAISVSRALAGALADREDLVLTALGRLFRRTQSNRELFYETDLESTEARELFLKVVGDRLPGGSIREEDAYGPFQNILGPVAAVSCSLFMVVASGLDLLRRGFDWQTALFLAVGVFFSLGTIGWLVERMKKPAIIILIEPKASLWL